MRYTCSIKINISEYILFYIVAGISNAENFKLHKSLHFTNVKKRLSLMVARRVIFSLESEDSFFFRLLRDRINESQLNFKKRAKNEYMEGYSNF